MSSVGYAECVEAEEHLDETPPCDMRLAPEYRECGVPSVVRGKFTCQCGDVAVRFICGPHYADVNRGYVLCHRCLSVPLSWVEI